MMIRVLRQALFYLRLIVIGRAGLLAVGLTIWALVYRAFAHPSPALYTLFFATAIVFFMRLSFGYPTRRNYLTSLLDRIEMGALVLALSHAFVQFFGGPLSWAEPVVYIAMAYLIGFNSRMVGVLLGLLAIGFEFISFYAFATPHFDYLSWSIHCGYIMAFALANVIFLQGEIARRRKIQENKISEAVKALHDDARDYRLISSSLTTQQSADRAVDESKLMRAAVSAIHESMFFILDMLKKSLDLQTCIVLWLDNQGKMLKIRELVTDSRHISETAISAQAGAIGGIVKNRLLLNLRSRSRGSKGIAYYSGPEQVGAFIGVPILEEGHLRGVLCADRRADKPFVEGEETLLVEATRQVLRSIQNERVFSAVERAKYEHERFYKASSMLNGALTLDQVYQTAFNAAQQIIPFDFAAVTLFDAEKRKHSIEKVWGQHEGLEGQTFSNNAGLAAMVVKNKHFLPAGESKPDRNHVLFTRKLKVKTHLGSLIVLPLIVQDEAVGTISFGAESYGRFPKRIREMLTVISNQVAVSVANAKMYQQMEEMATTDGLTGLPNHRTYQSRFSEMLHRAERHSQPVSIVLTDIDKFKSVNDTYGHPVGDMVLRRVSKVLANQVRKVDVVARYGGEEFVLVLEDTDSAGAHLLCERIRNEIAAQVMSSDKGAFRVTLSLGIASYPFDGKEKKLLIDRADQALYHAKESGRNRSIRYSEYAQDINKRAS